MSDQLDMFGAAGTLRAVESRDAALDRVASNSDAEWRDAAWSWLVDYLGTHETFFPDDVWAAGCPVPRELRAFGPLVMRAAREGLIEKTGEWRQRTRGNASAAQVWRSLVRKAA